MHFFSLLNKNFTYWRRSKCATICEMITPLIFGLFFLVLESQKTTTDIEKTSYLNQAFTLNPTGASAAMTFPQNYADMVKNSKMPILKTCNDPELQYSGYIGLTPKSNPINTKLDSFFKAAGYKTKFFDSDKEMDDFVQRIDYGGLDSAGNKDALCFAISVNKTVDKQWSYALRFNSSGNPDWRDQSQNKEDQIQFFVEEAGRGRGDYLQRLRKSGLLLMKNLIDTIILQEQTGVSTAQIQTKIAKMPTLPYEKTDIYTISNEGNVSFWIIFPLMTFYLRFVYMILNEKERRITENLRNMGMNMFAHYSAWIIFYTSVLFVAGILWTGLAWFSIFRHTNIIAVFSLFFLTGWWLLSVGFFVSSFFVKAKPGVLFSLILFFVFFGTRIGYLSISEPSRNTTFWFNVSPFVGLHNCGRLFVLIESTSKGFGFDLFTKTVNGINYMDFIFFTLGQTFLFFLLGMYFDQVWPTEIGVKKHPLFCCLKKKSARDKVSQEQQKQHTEQQYLEEIDQGLLDQRKQRKTITIENLRKQYPNGKVAVHNLSLEMYTDQIFALLGHNGAGKTTTISMISGLLPLTSGSIEILGVDAQANPDKVKEIIGVCPQKNPIYDSLTVAEHLRLYGKIKQSKEAKRRKKETGDKVSPAEQKKQLSELEKEIDDLLVDIDLSDKKNYPAGGLSGGQKRKLCVAMAFIGGSKVILLDEPTSGMDTYARRHLWEMLKNYKKGRIIILTTHYMDEADFLGDRIGIMGEGKLLTCGSSLFLKNKFGVGYDLTVVKKSSEVPTEKLEKLVKEFIPTGELSGDISMELKFRLPIEEAPNFEKLFQKLETSKEENGIQSFGISLTTLEEVFLKVAVGLDQNKLEVENQALEEELAELANFKLSDIRVKGAFRIFMMHYWALIKKRFIYFRRDFKGLLCEIFVPMIIVLLGLLLTRVSFISVDTQRELAPSLLDGYQQDVFVNANPPWDPAYQAIDQNIGSLSKLNFATAKEFDSNIAEKNTRYHLYNFFTESADTTNHVYSYTAFVNTTVANGGLLSQTIMNDGILKLATNDNKASIRTWLAPMVLTQQIKEFGGSVGGFTAIFLFALAFAFIPSSIILFLVKERENNVKHQQIVSGVSLIAYWSSNFTIDMIKYLIPAIFSALMVLLFDAKAFIEDGKYLATWVIFLLFGPCLLSFTYMTSFWFKSPSGAQIFTFVINYLAGFILMLMTFILRVIDSTMDISVWGTEWIFRLLPAFNFSFGLFNLASDVIFQIVFQLEEKPKPFGWYGALREILMMIFTTILYSFFIFLFEHPGLLSCRRKQKIDTKALLEKYNKDLDEDVLKEAEEVKNNADYAVKVENLVKVYQMAENRFCGGSKLKTKTAVKGISFGVKRGECFGLLGTNGAGKTTTFKMLSGEVIPTNGETFIDGKNVTKGLGDKRHLVGYCPQFDALLERLTSREHLELYAAIKGIPYKMWDQLIESTLKNLNLKKFEHVQAGTYSGGNKRKLSVGMALLGNPPVILLDEPSSGMDPEARRFMWSVVGRVSTIQKNSSVILTTHSMEEAEALSTKLAIMVEGNIKCIGPVQQLKSKYGKGFEIEAKVKLPTAEIYEELKTKADVKDLDQELTHEQINAVFDRLDSPFLKALVAHNGPGGALYNELVKSGEKGTEGTVKAKSVLEFAFIQICGDKTKKFLEQNFGTVEVIETFQSFFRFKIVDDAKLSELFGKLEREKNVLSLSQYSIKQTSIEQIFISFAERREVDQG